jgi:hypothetical protein
VLQGLVQRPVNNPPQLLQLQTYMHYLQQLRAWWDVSAAPQPAAATSQQLLQRPYMCRHLDSTCHVPPLTLATAAASTSLTTQSSSMAVPPVLFLPSLSDCCFHSSALLAIAAVPHSHARSSSGCAPTPLPETAVDTHAAVVLPLVLLSAGSYLLTRRQLADPPEPLPKTLPAQPATQLCVAPPKRAGMPQAMFACRVALLAPPCCWVSLLAPQAMYACRVRQSCWLHPAAAGYHTTTSFTALLLTQKGCPGLTQCCSRGGVATPCFSMIDIPKCPCTRGRVLPVMCWELPISRAPGRKGVCTHHLTSLCCLILQPAPGLRASAPTT